MELDQYSGLVSFAAVVTTILQFLSGALVCKKYVHNKTTAEASPLPFTCGVLSCSLWLMYGLVKQDDIIVLVNIIGVTLMTAYTIVFYVVTFKKSVVMRQVSAVFIILVFIIGYSATRNEVYQLMHELGQLACCLTLVTIGAPLSKLFHVIKVKNTDCLPFPMILMMLIVSLLWFLYGIIEEDNYLVFPNFLGAILALLQLSLFVIYPSRPQFSTHTEPLLA